MKRVLVLAARGRVAGWGRHRFRLAGGRLRLLAVLLAAGGLALSVGPSRVATSTEVYSGGPCVSGGAVCTEVQYPDAFGDDVYIGHDEASVLYYSNESGSGNSNFYLLTLPTEPPVPPQQDRKGGTGNFQLYSTFWLGMAMCDTESFPVYTHTCTPNSDANIFDNASKSAPDYIGHHPGTAFTELQFYPPGWVNKLVGGTSCDATSWCAALTIDSLSIDPNSGRFNNRDCLETAGVEPVNIAHVTKSGVASTPADPLSNPALRFFADPATALFMHPGDALAIDMHDTPDGLTTIIYDLTTGETGSMTASIANGFAQVIFDPDAKTCKSRPYAFHPMYATSSEHTRVPWASHSFNVTLTMEMGHFEYCDTISAHGAVQRGPLLIRQCESGSADPPESPILSPGGDDSVCFARSATTLIPISGCTGTDNDFDGVSYQTDAWPGSIVGAAADARVHASPLRFTSPLFNGGRDYQRTAFETNIPSISHETNPGCITERKPTGPQRPPGSGCTLPPKGAPFYPLYSTAQAGTSCVWQFGGTHLPGTIETFGGTAAAEFGPVAEMPFASPRGAVARLLNFRRILAANPCPVAGLAGPGG